MARSRPHSTLIGRKTVRSSVLGIQPRLQPKSSRATKQTINRYHQLHKRESVARAAGQEAEAAQLRTEIEAQGGLRSYQEASKTGQKGSRGGDTSQVLVSWLKDVPQPLQLLEIGALSAYNACSRSEIFGSVTRIDLRSQSQGIEQQDFMERRLPENDEAKFDVISLSLVLNFVGESNARGEMLRRLSQFLRGPAVASTATEPTEQPLTPSVFLVLPAACLTNSRYLTQEHFIRIMNSLGFVEVRKRLSAKLIYYLFVLIGFETRSQSFKKQEINPGPARNNFTIVLD